MKCPSCGKDGAVILGVFENGLSEVYCNSCVKTMMGPFCDIFKNKQYKNKENILGFPKKILCPICKNCYALLKNLEGLTCNTYMQADYECDFCGYKFDKIMDVDSCCSKEEQTMKVSYNGFTGDLVKLERKLIPGTGTSTVIDAIHKCVVPEHFS